MDDTQKVTITMALNGTAEEVWEEVDEWIGSTAPDSTDSFHVEFADVATHFSGEMALDPEIRYSQQGIAQTTMFLFNGDNRVQVVCFGELAENIALSLRQGQQVIAVGTMDALGEMTAWNVGPSLQKATAEVKPVQRRP
jgi:hypothetical protein